MISSEDHTRVAILKEQIAHLESVWKTEQQWARKLGMHSHAALWLPLRIGRLKREIYKLRGSYAS